jgi:hypothetical protein
MGSGPKPEWTGIDKTVRDIFPEDWQRTWIPNSITALDHWIIQFGSFILVYSAATLTSSPLLSLLLV